MPRDIHTSNRVKIAPSILSADFANIERDIARVEEAGADWLHVDVMDGVFVPNITLGPVVIKSLRKLTDMPFDVHLMVDHPERYLEDFYRAGADIITVHAEATLHLQRTLSVIKELGAYAGLSLNPSTSLDMVDWILDDIDLLLVMSVNPGFGGQSFIPSMLDKIAKAKEMIGDRDVYIMVDGGIKDKNIGDVVDSGANAVVAGSFTFKANNGDVAGNIKRLRQAYG